MSQSKELLLVLHQTTLETELNPNQRSSLAVALVLTRELSSIKDLDLDLDRQAFLIGDLDRQPFSIVDLVLTRELSSKLATVLVALRALLMLLEDQPPSVVEPLLVANKSSSTEVLV